MAAASISTALALGKLSEISSKRLGSEINESPLTTCP